MITIYIYNLFISDRTLKNARCPNRGMAGKYGDMFWSIAAYIF